MLLLSLLTLVKYILKSVLFPPLLCSDVTLQSTVCVEDAAPPSCKRAERQKVALLALGSTRIFFSYPEDIHFHIYFLQL